MHKLVSHGINMSNVKILNWIFAIKTNGLKQRDVHISFKSLHHFKPDERYANVSFDVYSSDIMTLRFSSNSAKAENVIDTIINTLGCLVNESYYEIF